VSSVTPIRPGVELKPLGIPGVRVLGVALRCMSCHAEWRADLDPFMAVVPDTARCPRCTARTPPEAA
jgi:hypothetical protein